MRTAAFVVAALGILLAAVAIFAPATLVDRGLAATTAGRLRVAEASGTVWSGSGLLTDATNAWRVPLAWKVSPAALLRGVLHVTLVPEGAAATPRGTIDVAGDTLRMREIGFDVAATALSTGLPSRNAVALGGTVSLESPAFEWSGGRGTGTLNARWRGARLVAGGSGADLGTVDVTLAPRDDRLAGHVGNTGGDVQIDGAIAIAGAAVSVDAAVTPAASAPPAIARALAALGTPDGNGTVRIAWRGSLR